MAWQEVQASNRRNRDRILAMDRGKRLGGPGDLALDEAALQRGLATIRKNYETSVARGRITAEAPLHDVLESLALFAEKQSPGLLCSIHVVSPDGMQLLHANDSKDECGSTRDRHETIGQGRIGAAAFAVLCIIGWYRYFSGFSG